LKLTKNIIRQLIREQAQKILGEQDTMTKKKFTRPNYDASKEIGIKYINVGYDVPNVGIDKLREEYEKHFRRMGSLKKMLDYAKKKADEATLEKYQAIFEEGEKHTMEFQNHPRWEDLKNFYKENPTAMASAEKSREDAYNLFTLGDVRRSKRLRLFHGDLIDAKKAHKDMQDKEARVRKTLRDDPPDKFGVK